MINTINIPPSFTVTTKQFELLSIANRDLRLELTADGELIIMPPTGGITGIYNAEISAQFVVWNQQTKLGIVFDSSTAFKLPNSAILSPDVSWIQLARWQQLIPEEKATFPPICPDFILELMSPTDKIKNLREKMSQYLANGARLGWLIDPKTKTVEIYQLNQSVKILRSPTSLSDNDILPGLILDLGAIFS